MKRLNFPALAWAVVVTLLLAHGASLWINQRLTPDTDILALLPAQDRDPAVQQAFAHMADAAQQKVIVLVGARDWENARRAADAYRAVLSPHADLLQFTDSLGEQAQQDWLALFQQHRMALLTDADEAALHTQDRQYWVESALSKLYSPFAGPKIGAWQDDPFGLFGGWVQARAQETPVRPRDGRLFVTNGERTYIVMPLNLHVPAFSMDAQKTVTPLLVTARHAAIAAVPGAEVLEAGVILHAAAAGKQASSEISTIGFGSLLGIVLLIWFSFRSLKPFAYITLLLGVGFLGALSICMLLFGRVHLLTLVFGATLIGVAQDYGIYFLCHRVGADAATTSQQLLRHLRPGLLLTLAAAAIGYAGLALTPFPGLRQMAVFSIMGLMFAWLTVVCWYPLLISATSLKNAGQAQAFSAVLRYWPVLRADRRSALVLLAVAALLAFGWSRLEVNDNIRSLQNPPKHLLDEQIKLSKLLDAPTPVQFYLVRGTTAEQVLQREEALKRRLDPLISQGKITGYQAISNWVPSALTQTGRHRLAEEKLLADGAALAALAVKLGEDENWLRTRRERAINESALTVDAFMAAPASAPWRHLWLGRSGEGYASVVALRGLGLASLPELQRAADGVTGVQWVDKVADISTLLGKYRQYMGWALLFSYAAVFCLLFLRYRGSTWRVLAPTALASGVTLALLGILGQPLQLFHVLALMLLLGIGVDYGVFFQERPERREASAWMAVSLSAASTLLSFGLLGLSKTPALQAFGLTMLFGTALVWLIVPCFAREDAAEEQTVRVKEAIK